MMDLKEKVDENNTTKSYEEFERLVRSEYPNPLYIYDEEEEYAERFVKENPGAIILGKGIKGTALCMDSHTTLKYAYENAKAMGVFVYSCCLLKMDMISTTVDTVWKEKGGD